MKCDDPAEVTETMMTVRDMVRVAIMLVVGNQIDGPVSIVHVAKSADMENQVADRVHDLAAKATRRAADHTPEIDDKHCT